MGKNSMNMSYVLGQGKLTRKDYDVMYSDSIKNSEIFWGKQG